MNLKWRDEYGLDGVGCFNAKKKEKRKKEKSLLECVHDEWVNGKKLILLDGMICWKTGMIDNRQSDKTIVVEKYETRNR